MWRIHKDELEHRPIDIQSTDYTTLHFEALGRAEKLKQFRLYDGDDNLYFTGWTDDRSLNDFAPLDDYGRAFGCVKLTYYEDGVWKEL